MSNRALACLAGFLAATCAGQGYYIHKQKSAVDMRDALSDSDSWISRVRSTLASGKAIPSRMFDEVFDDTYFNRKIDPFAEIQGFRKAIAPLIEKEDQRSLFARSWDEWFTQRMEVADLHPDVSTGAKEVTVSIKVPGLQTDSVKVDVNDDRIRLLYSAESTRSEKGPKGVYRSESIREFEKILPVPSQADPEKRRVVRDGDTIRIVFDRRR